MSSVANVVIHQSQFPQSIRRDLLHALRTRKVNHKFHYDSVKQTQKWLALHEAFSPARNDPDCAAIYERSFAGAASELKAERVHAIGLGCGGGQKDTQLMKLLRDAGKGVFYTPCDVSTPMVLVARQTALSLVPEQNCFPLVGDLVTMDDLPAVLESMAESERYAEKTRERGLPANCARFITFFGMIPTFEPQDILPKIASLVGPDDCLLFSANLAPGSDYAAGMKKILPQYDNALTRDWLMTFLLDLGVERDDGELRFCIEDGEFDLKRVTAHFHFSRACRVQIESEAFEFRPGESIQLFFSYRYTPDHVQKILNVHGLAVREQWTTRSGEEGVFLCRKQR